MNWVAWHPNMILNQNWTDAFFDIKINLILTNCNVITIYVYPPRRWNMFQYLIQIFYNLFPSHYHHKYTHFHLDERWIIMIFDSFYYPFINVYFQNGPPSFFIFQNIIRDDALHIHMSNIHRLQQTIFITSFTSFQW